MPDMLTLRAHRFKALHDLLTGEAFLPHPVNNGHQPPETTSKTSTPDTAQQEAVS